MIDTVIAKNKDGSFIRVTWKRNGDGTYSTRTEHYGIDGYCNAGLTRERRNITIDDIENFRYAAKQMFHEVTEH